MALPCGVVASCLDGKVDGDLVPIRTTSTGGVTIGFSCGERFEASVRGELFVADNNAVGSTLANQAALSTAVLMFLYNPPGSQKLLSMLSVNFAYRIGTWAAGSLYLTATKRAAKQTEIAAGGTDFLTRRGRLSSTRTNAAANVGNEGMCGQVTLAVAGEAIMPLMSFGSPLATSDLPTTACTTNLNGSVVVLPGYWVALEVLTTGAGTTPSCNASMMWEEVSVDDRTLITLGNR